MYQKPVSIKFMWCDQKNNVVWLICRNVLLCNYDIIQVNVSVKISDNLIFLLHDCKMKCPYNFPKTEIFIKREWFMMKHILTLQNI